MKNFIFVPSSTHKLIDLSTKPKFSSLEDWKFRPVVKPVSYIGRKAYVLEKQARRLSWDFISTDFINPPSCQASRLPNFRKRCAFAVAERHLHFGLLARGQGFTMAEILISLTIIGVIAAITLPSLRTNINEKTWATQRKALYSRMSQAIVLLPSLNGYGIVMKTDGTINYTSTNSKAAMTFVTDGLSKVLKINNICDNEHYANCGINQNYTDMTGKKSDMPKDFGEFNQRFTDVGIKRYKFSAIETNSGESILVMYNPLCYSDMKLDTHVQFFVCANFLYDLNGKKGPNTIGKDMGFITALYSTDSNVVAPMPISKNIKYTKSCSTTDKNSRIPNFEELISLFANKDIVGINFIKYSSLASSTMNSSGNRWGIHFSSGNYLDNIDPQSMEIRCVKR